MKKIYEYSSYKTYLKDFLKTQGRGTLSQLSEAAGCSRVYLSQVLSTKVQLLPDHAFGLSERLGLTPAEQDFFLHLVLYERSKTPAVQARIREKLQIKIEADLVLTKKIESRKDAKELTREKKERYYQSWKMAMAHSLTSVPTYQTVAKIAARTQLKDPEVINLLKELVEMGLVIQKGSQYMHSGESLHIKAGDPLHARNHLNWRLRSIEDADNSGSLHYTTVFSISKSDWERLRRDVISFIEKQREIIHASGTDEVYCFCCDLFEA